MLSDMVTVMTMEDVEPNRLVNTFVPRVNECVPEFQWTKDSLQIIQEYEELLSEDDTVGIPPMGVFCNLQITWRDAPGTLRQTIVADG